MEQWINGSMDNHRVKHSMEVRAWRVRQVQTVAGWMVDRQWRDGGGGQMMDGWLAGWLAGWMMDGWMDG